MIFTGYDCLQKNLKAELIQKRFEGSIIPEALKKRIDQLDNADYSKAQKIKEALDQIKMDPEYEMNHPYELADIKKQRPDGPRKLNLTLSEEELLDRFHGAWSGRAAGCALGKPVEGLGMSGTESLSGREAIKAYLLAQDNWPLDNYFSADSKMEEIKLLNKMSVRENIRYMEPDDDIHYTLIGLKVVENHAGNFKWHNIADTWNRSLPYNTICTAETQAIMNYNIMTPRRKGDDVYTTAHFTAVNNNPYREWIGAQIRADGWAYVCAGHPEFAAEFAWRDAHWTHTANGIYGEMFMAAVIAAAFVVSDPYELVKIGLSEIPENCHLAKAVEEALQWIEDKPDFEGFMDKLDATFADMSPVHTINNALIVIMSLFYGEMAFDESICISVMGALDTDCNGATTGSIVGAVNGYKNTNSNLIPPLNDTIKPLVFGFQEITMTELAERTMTQWKQIAISI